MPPSAVVGRVEILPTIPPTAMPTPVAPPSPPEPEDPTAEVSHPPVSAPAPTAELTLRSDALPAVVERVDTVGAPAPTPEPTPEPTPTAAEPTVAEPTVAEPTVAEPMAPPPAPPAQPARSPHATYDELQTAIPALQADEDGSTLPAPRRVDEHDTPPTAQGPSPSQVPALPRAEAPVVLRRATYAVGGLGFAGIAGLVLAVALGVAWLLLHTKVRFWQWDRTATAPLTDDERAELATCGAPSWSTWLKVATTNPELACGEAWAVTRLADKLESDDRARWLALRVGDPALDPGTRVRGAVALALAGYDSPSEPAWLVEQLGPDRRAMWNRAALESETVAPHLGPAMDAIAIAARAREGEVDPGVAIPALEWLAIVDDRVAEATAARIATDLAGGYPALVAEVHARRAAGRPVTGLGRDWMRIIDAHPECEPRCAALWTEVLSRTLADEAIDLGVAPPPDPAEHPRVAQLLTTVGASATEHRAIGWAVAAAAQWVKASPNPAARLRTLAARPSQPAPIARLAWDGVGLPFASAVVLSAIGELAEVPVEVRVGDAGEVWLRIGGVDVARACAAPGAVPDSPAWPPDSVLAAALTEAAAGHVEQDPVRALRIATAAERIDPLVAGPLAIRIASAFPPELDGGRRIGMSLLRSGSSPPSGADAARRRLGDRGPATCAVPVEGGGPVR